MNAPLIPAGPSSLLRKGIVPSWPQSRIEPCFCARKIFHLQAGTALSRIMLQRQTHRILLPSFLIGVGWVLLAWNLIILITGSAYPSHANLVQQAARTVSSNLIRVTMLTFGAIALSLVAYLHFKHAYSRATTVATVIIAVLAFCLLFPAYSPASAVLEVADSNSAAGQISESEIYADGLVTGIVFSDDRPAVVVGSQVLYEGDIKQGVTIVRITKTEVQFEKNGMLWTQAVQEAPPPHWK